MRNVNGYLVEHPKLLLGLMWAFVAAAVIPGFLLNLLLPNLGFFIYLAIIGIPGLIALYFRLLYGKVQERRREEQRKAQAAENAKRYQHKKKKM